MVNWTQDPSENKPECVWMGAPDGGVCVSAVQKARTPGGPGSGFEATGPVLDRSLAGAGVAV